MVETKQWPAMWRTEYGVPLQKVSNPEDENQLRIISLTTHFSKTFENMVIKWLYKYIGHKLDPQQFGGRKGSSITHYTIELLNFILYNQDLTNPNAVLVLMADSSSSSSISNSLQCKNTTVMQTQELFLVTWSQFFLVY